MQFLFELLAKNLRIKGLFYDTLQFLLLPALFDIPFFLADDCYLLKLVYLLGQICVLLLQLAIFDEQPGLSIFWLWTFGQELCLLYCSLGYLLEKQFAVQSKDWLVVDIDGCKHSHFVVLAKVDLKMLVESFELLNWVITIF